MRDVLIRGGRIVDGTGRDPFPGDVLVSEGRIAAVGDVQGATATVIDAGDAIVAPGFIDLHTHCDFTIHRHPEAPAAIHQGVTTLVMGNCGFSGFPSRPSGLARMSQWCGFIGGQAELLSTDGAARFEALESLALGPNVAQLVGHGALRLAVMGDEARPATSREVDEMDATLQEALASGAAGMSTGLVYAPGIWADRAELERLGRIIAEYDGVYATHIRDEGAGVADAVAEAIEIAQRTGARVHISHLKSTAGAGPAAARLLSMIADARNVGLRVSADQYPYTMSSTKLGAIPSLGEVDASQVVIATDPSGRFAGRTLAQVAVDHRQRPADFVDGLPQSVRDEAQVLLLDRMRESDVQEIVASPSVAVASDGWTLAPGPDSNPHPRNLGTFSRILARYTRDLGTLPVQLAIHKMTALPAEVLGLGDRGRICPGMIADLVVFRTDEIVEGTIARSPSTYAGGMRVVMVAGDIVLRDGDLTGSRPGRVLRRAAV